ncbi:MAG: ParB/RepB/Spo0J family partition protein [Alphaproteobacteria bacterium]|nr:ParB/RepB/Spo0J family partition protein [Alphaproteobacteria bacterium]
MSERRGLGRGLSALLGEPVRTTDFQRPAEPPKPSAWIPPAPPVQETPPSPAANPAPNVVELPSAHQAPQPAPPTASLEPTPRGIAIELIQRNPDQPRKHFDERELEELADSIRTHGVLQPILVRPLPNHPGRYEIVAGERRWRAAQKASLHVIPAVIRELDDTEILEIGIIENVQRADLNPIEEAQGYQALMDRFGRTQQDVADVVGKSRPHVANMLRLLSLSGDIQDMVRDGRLSAGHARAILTAPDPMELALKAIREQLNVREIERIAQAAKDAKDGPRTSGGGGAGKDADTIAMERRLSEALGLEVLIADKDGAGEVKIAYKTLEQLDEIARRITAAKPSSF